MKSFDDYGTLLVERFSVHRELTTEMLVKNGHQVGVYVLQGSNDNYGSPFGTIITGFHEFKDVADLVAIVSKDISRVKAAVLNIESFSTSGKDKDRGNLFGEYFTALAQLPNLQRIVVTSPLTEREARERFPQALEDSRVRYLRKPYITEELEQVVKF